MPERVTAAAAAPVLDTSKGHDKNKDAVCVHTKKIYDACRDKDCLEDLRIYLTRCSQEIVDRAINVKCRKTELIWAYIDVAMYQCAIAGYKSL